MDSDCLRLSESLHLQFCSIDSRAIRLNKKPATGGRCVNTPSRLHGFSEQYVLSCAATAIVLLVFWPALIVVRSILFKLQKVGVLFNTPFIYTINFESADVTGRSCGWLQLLLDSKTVLYS